MQTFLTEQLEIINRKILGREKAMKQEGSNNLLLPLNTSKGWNEDLKKEVEELISNLTPEKVIDELTKLNKDENSSNKNVGRPISYKTAWIQLESNLIDFSEFKALVFEQLRKEEITHYTYKRALKKAKEFLDRRKITLTTKKLTYQEAWIEFYTAKINWEEFQLILQQLLKEKSLTQEKFEEAQKLGNQFRKLRQNITSAKD